MKASARHLLLLAALSIGAVCYAQSSDEARLKPQWQALDANRDGKVMLNELAPLQAATMKGSDFDGNSEMSLAEYVAYDLDPGGAARRPLTDNVKLIADVPYADTKDPRQRLDIYLPKKASVKGPLPVIAYVHGGAWMMGSKVGARSQVMAPVESGRYAAVSIGHRLSWQATWPAQIDDVKAAIRWIRAHAKEYGFDPNRICAIGGSAGGHLVAQLGLTNGDAAAEGKLGKHLNQSSKVQCVIDLLGPSDLRTVAVASAGSGPSAVDQLLGGTPAQKPQLAADASPITHVDKNDPSFLIVHGTADPVVSYRQSVELDKALRQAGVPVIFQTVEGGGHGDFGAAQAEVERRIRAFLEKSLYDPSITVPADTLRR